MEKEYKWQFSGEADFFKLLATPDIAPLVYHQQTIQMEAIYYDTADGLISGIGGGLRLRKENEHTVCCLKITSGSEGAMKIREEYECAASTVEEGLRHLPAYGAPAALCDTILMLCVLETCRTVFTRRAVTLIAPDFSAELAFDSGMLLNGGKTGEICELELECLKGNTESFDDYCKKLEHTFALKPQPLSKLARALALAK